MHLSTHDFNLKCHSSNDGKTFNHLSWDVMTKKKTKDNKIKYQGGMVDISVGKAAAQDAGLSEEKRLTKWVCKVFKELWLNKIENSEN